MKCSCGKIEFDFFIIKKLSEVFKLFNFVFPVAYVMYCLFFTGAGIALQLCDFAERNNLKSYKKELFLYSTLTWHNNSL